MLNPDVCNPNTIVGSWAGFSWQIFGILTNTMVMIPTLLLIIGVPWITNFRKRWKQAVSGLGVLLLLTYLFMLSPNSIRLEERLLVKPLPTDNGAKADAIVVLGRGQELRAERVAVAKQLWQAGRAPTVFASGSGDAIEIGALLKEEGVPERAVDGEPCSRTTEENAVNSGKYDRSNSGKSVWSKSENGVGSSSEFKMTKPMTSRDVQHIGAIHGSETENSGSPTQRRSGIDRHQ